MQKKLPADPSSLILGIIGLVMGIVICCCFPFISIIPLVLSIWGLVMANKSIRLYRIDASEYTESSRSNVSIGRVLNILSIIMNGFLTISILLMFLFIGAAGIEDFRNGLTEGLNGDNTNDWEYEDTYEDVYDLEEVDSLSTDSIFLQEVYPDSDSIE